MSLPTFENLLLEISEGVATVSFHRPKALNALNEATLKELRSAVNWIEHHAAGREGADVGDHRVDVVILTGSGEKSFVAGADILEMKDKSYEDGEAFARLGQGVTRAIELLPQPVIAAVNGFALGGGCEFALACDFILASENALFGQPEVALGIIPGFGGSVRLPAVADDARPNGGHSSRSREHLPLAASHGLRVGSAPARRARHASSAPVSAAPSCIAD